ncbi:chymotrypsin-2-like isoform X2 [Pieris brassicae]|uniref:chymotrypsin-2-like isoform X2 n=1 Tax=Pieris brassicae TaxID=7116 RepID=UPI001E661A19|nr:chymotrypsin-2-like isoform X2 [Pieris brassicae]
MYNFFGEVHVSEPIDGDSRIIGGKDATPDMAHYQVSIRGHQGNQEWHSCGVFILNEEYVLTAAHCVFKKNMKDMSIVAGSHTIDKGGDRYKIKKLVPHEKYTKPVVKNDIGIVQIEGKIKYSDKVQPIKLLKEMAPIGKKCLFTGWGYVHLRRKTLPNNLQMLEYETISNDDCTKQLKKSPYPKLMPIDAGQICANRPNEKGACYGDSGGPLVIQDDENNTVQIGVVSWVVPCARKYPDVFASVHGYYD